MKSIITRARERERETQRERKKEERERERKKERRERERLIHFNHRKVETGRDRYRLIERSIE